mgnify:CR=1 FL=1
MKKTTLGRTELRISRLGAGLSEIGGLSLENENDVARILNDALDSGINFLDTAACYGVSEELVGKTVSHRRSEYVLASKCGHIAGDWKGEAWTRETIEDSINRSLVRLQTDYLDLMQLHSCSQDILEEGVCIETLQRARDAGKVRYIGYSGDNEPAHWAVNSGIFDTLQTSFSLVDQHAYSTGLLQAAKSQNMGVIIKRPIGNGVWGAQSAPSSYSEEYFRRAQEMMADGPIQDAPSDRILLAMGFTFAHPEIDTAIIGTKNHGHMLSNIEMVDSQLPISNMTVSQLHDVFAAHDSDWIQQI